MKISELSEATNVSVYVLRQHAKNIFGHDKIAKRQSGFARDLSIDEAWKLYLYSVLVSLLHSTHFAKSCLENTPDIKTQLWIVEEDSFALKIIKLKSLYENFTHLTSR